MVNGETRAAGEAWQLQEKGRRAQPGDPSAQPHARLLPKTAPNHAPALATED